MPTLSGSRPRLSTSNPYSYRLCDLATQRDHEGNAGTSMTQHLDQGIHAEPVDLSPDEVTDSRLGHSKEFRGSRLRQFSCFDELGEFDHKVGPHLEVLRLLSTEPEVGEDISARGVNLYGHSLFLSAPPLGLHLLQASPSEIQVGCRDPLALLPEGVKDVHCLLELGDVDDPVLESAPDADLGDTSADGSHGLPVARHQALLDSAQLVTRSTPRQRGKGPYIGERGPDP